MTGPSASGSENGTPSSTRSAPPSAYAKPTSLEPSIVGKPPMRYGMSAARPGASANARPMASVSVAATGQHLREVLVAPARAAQEIHRRAPAVLVDGVVQCVGRLERRDDPLQPGDLAERGVGLLVAHRDVGRPPRVAQPRVLGSRPGVVEAGRDGVRLGDLTVLVLHDGGERPVQHARPAAHGERRAVASRLDALAGGLDADEPHVRVVDERGERPHRVGAAPDTRDDAVRQPSRALQERCARLVADDALQVAHERGVRRGPDDRADDVVGGRDVGDPVADRLRRRLLQRLAPGLDRHDRRAEQPHALDVGRLAPRVLAAHVDDALEIEERRGRRTGDAVLARPRLGDHAPLAHPPREQRLAEGVVELVRPGVHEVLALEPQLAPGDLGEALGEVQRRRAPAVVAQQHLELGAVAGVVARRDPLRLELGERRHQRLGYVLPAVGPVAVGDSCLDLAHAVTSDSFSSATGSGAASSTAALNARTSSGSFTPGELSVPLATSTAQGRTVPIASPTFSGVRPPARMSGGPPRGSARTISQPKDSPPPPSSRWKSVRKGPRPLTSPRSRTRTALMTFAPVRRATSLQNAGPSSPWSCTIVSPRTSAISTTRARRSLTNTPVSSTLRRIARAMRPASSSEHLRAESGHRIIPSAQAPASTQSSASWREVIPQCLIRTEDMPPTLVHYSVSCPTSARTASAMSLARMSASPTRTASTPTRSRSSSWSRVWMPDSETTVLPAGTSDSSSYVRSRSTEKSVRSRLLMPITSASIASSASSSSRSSWTSTSTSRSSACASPYRSVRSSTDSAAQMSSSASAPAAAVSYTW